MDFQDWYRSTPCRVTYDKTLHVLTSNASLATFEDERSLHTLHPATLKAKVQNAVIAQEAFHKHVANKGSTSVPKHGVLPDCSARRQGFWHIMIEVKQGTCDVQSTQLWRVSVVVNQASHMKVLANDVFILHRGET